MAYKFAGDGAILVNSPQISVEAVIRKSADGTALPALTYSDITSASYRRQGGARVAITPATLASPSAAWAVGGFVLIDDTNQTGLYRHDIPDAACVSGADFVAVTLKTASGFIFHREFALVLPPGAIYSCIPSAIDASSITFPSDAPWSGDNDCRNFVAVTRTALAGIAQVAQIGSYVASTRIATLRNAWNTTPTSDATHPIVIDIYPSLPGVNTTPAGDIDLSNAKT